MVKSLLYPLLLYTKAIFIVMYPFFIVMCPMYLQYSIILTYINYIDNIRLVDGNGPSQGRLEVYYRGEWGTVCDDLFDINEANVVCRQLGYRRATRWHDRAYFGRGTGTIWLDNLTCGGTETRLHECGSNGIGVNNCGHNEDVGVVCEGMINGLVCLKQTFQAIN